jgi:hypothetical protein
MDMQEQRHRPRPLRRPLGRHKKAVALHTDTYLSLRSYAERHNLTWSGAIHELLRTHPLIDLPSLLAVQQDGERQDTTTTTTISEPLQP